MTQDELRKRFRAWCRANERGERPPFPPECRDLRCGAKTRAGTPCKRRDLYASGRCKLHGGLSTGPKSGPRAKRPEPPTVEPRGVLSV
ncbi:HGGxSTG domain-containing protein [Vreelandella zhaodongensis]|uniref:HGGxSTG domain-containing protein n=1 Tax=Vreelandella zhaodongensis TaxID=1176240 RepID=UPI003EBF24B1